MNGHNRLHQGKSRPRRPSYHVHLAFGGGGSGGGHLDAGGGLLDRLVLGQEASSVNQTEEHKREDEQVTEEFSLKLGSASVGIFVTFATYIYVNIYEYIYLPGWHGAAEHSATVDENVFVTVRVGDVFSALPRPRAFDLVQAETQNVFVVF